MEELRGDDGNGVIDIFDMNNRLTMEAFVHSAFGTPLNAIKSAPDDVPFTIAFDRMSLICTRRLFDFTWIIQRFLNIGEEHELKQHSKTVNDFIKPLVEDRKRNFADVSNETAHRYDLLSMYLKRYGLVLFNSQTSA